MSTCKNQNSKLKILFTLPTLNGGGAERVFVNYIRSLDKTKYEISLLLVNKTGEFLKFIPSFVNIYDIGSSKTRYGFFKLLKSIKIINPNLIVSTTNRMNILVLMISLFISKQIKICLYEPSMPSAQFGNKYLPKYYLYLMKLLYRYSDYIIAQTKEMRNEIAEYYSVNKNKIIVTSNPIDTKLIDENVSGYHNPYSSGYINIIASGRIREEKGYEFLLQSFAKVVTDNPKFKLFILGNIGNQVYMDKLKLIIKQYGLEDHVNFLGFLINPFPYYKYADLFVLSSRWEGLPNVVLEALYLKTPVVVTNCIPYFYELINEGKNGFVVDYGNEISMSQKIQLYSELEVQPNMLDLPNYNKIFYKMVYKSSL